ncbi:MAG TPA: NADH-quinone oxidoreductase subunit NuoK [Bacteroidia bacterium]|jgi:NADH-quinone oxidoreductase subunit K|nr:NADH-quinone oxidoreductase subunit NuoK [Bacteroidia bacterium]
MSLYLPSIVEFVEVSLILFLLGLWGLFAVRKNLITILISIELLLLAVNLNFVIFSVFLDDLVGQVFALSILTVAAAESAIGLAILVIFYRIRGAISVDFTGYLKG